MAVSKSAQRRMMDRYAGPAPNRAPLKEVEMSKEIPKWKEPTPTVVVEDEIINEDIDETTDDETTDDDTSTKTAGFMGVPTIAWIAIGGVALYFAYKKGMLKKIIK